MKISIMWATKWSVCCPATVVYLCDNHSVLFLVFIFHKAKSTVAKNKFKYKQLFHLQYKYDIKKKSEGHHGNCFQAVLLGNDQSMHNHLHLFFTWEQSALTAYIFWVHIFNHLKEIEFTYNWNHEIDKLKNFHGMKMAVPICFPKSIILKINTINLG